MLTKTDLTIIGGGPAGISAAVNAASEGLCTILVDSTQKFGGQAGSSSLIENFLGFPEGISGEELTKRSIRQADRFNVDFKAPFNVVDIQKNNDGWTIVNDDDESIECKVVLLAMGIQYRSLSAKNIARFIGAGVSYGSPSLSENYFGKTIGIIGGANSAGQAAVYLSSCPECKILLIIRSNRLEDKMSAYLVNKIKSAPNIEVFTNSEVTQACGINELKSVILSKNGILGEINLDRLFILIGAKPKTSWLKGKIVLDDNGFIVTGNDVILSDIYKGYNSSLKPLPSETIPGVFAAGDVRADSVKRVANAVGDGARAINDIHKYLSSTK